MNKLLGGYCRLIEWLLVAMMALMVVLVFGNVVARYAFNGGITVSEEVSRWLFVWMTFLGAVVGVRERAHLGSDMLTSRLGPTGKKICLALGQSLMIYATWLLFSGALSQTRLNIRFDGTQPPGQHRGLVAVFTNDPDYPVIQIPVVVGSRIISSPGSVGTAPVEAPRARSAPEMGRVVINRNVLSESGAADLQITAPANWQTGAVEAWPPQLNATYVPAKVTDNSATTTENTDAQTQKLALRVGVTELPPAGLNQGVLTLHFTTPDGPRMLTVPMSLIWL